MSKKLNYFTTIKFLSKYIWAYKKNYIMFAIGWMFDIMLKLFTPIMFAVMIDEIVYYRNTSVYLQISIALVIMILFACIVHYFTQQQYAYLQIMYAYEIKKDLFDALQNAKAEALTDMESGETLNTLQYYTFECMSFVIRNIIHTVNNGISLIFYIIYIFVIGWQFGLIMLLGIPLSVYATTKFGKITKKCNDEYNSKYGKYNGWLMERLSAISDIRLLQAQKTEEKKFIHYHKGLFDKANQNSVITLSAQNVVGTINFGVQMAVYGLCAFYASQGQITIGILTIILNYFANIKDKVRFFSDYFIEAQKRIATIQRVYDMFYLPSEKDWVGKDDLSITNANIEFHNISFSYKDRDELFSDFSLHIEGGQKVALVGRSGSGKSTLANMLIGFYQPGSGNIRIDGKDISECSLRAVRQNIGVVQQDVLIFDGTIRFNLLLGKKDASEQEIIMACERAGLTELIQSLEDGLDTVIGTKGIGLSGGQKQRIAIARIYLKDPKIIVFDEATSALDSETEACIHDSWRAVLDRRTVVVIAHRLSSVMMCEKVAFIENGKLLEYGDTKELLENSTELKTLFAI